MAAKRQSQETTDALIEKDVKNLFGMVEKLSKDVDENDKTYYVVFVSQKDFLELRRIVYGFCGVIMVSFLLGVARVVFK